MNRKTFKFLFKVREKPLPVNWCYICIMTNYQNIITINPEKLFGKPCIWDVRISVYDVLSWLTYGMTHEEIKNDFPEITEEDITACFVH